MRGLFGAGKMASYPGREARMLYQPLQSVAAVNGWSQGNPPLQLPALNGSSWSKAAASVFQHVLDHTGSLHSGTVSMHGLHNSVQQATS